MYLQTAKCFMSNNIVFQCMSFSIGLAVVANARIFVPYIKITGMHFLLAMLKLLLQLLVHKDVF